MERSTLGKMLKKLIALVVSLLVVAGGAILSATAANAADDDWTNGSTMVMVPDECSADGALVKVRPVYTVNGNHYVQLLTVDGAPAPADFEDVLYVLAGPGNHKFDFQINDLVVENPNPPVLRTDREFTVETCPEPDPEPINAPSPTQDGQNVTIKSVDGVAYVDQNSNTLTGVYVLEDGETITITPVATTDRPVTGGPWTFTWNAPAEPDPVAPVVDAQLIGLLTDGNESAVDATVTVVHNDATGPVTVILSNGDDVLWTQVFPEEQVEPLRAVVLTGACGDLNLTVEILDVDGSAKVVPVTVPCPASTGGDDDDDTNPGNGGDDGSNDNGSDNGSNTGNTNNGNNGGSSDKSDNTSKSVDTQKINSGNYSTGDTAFGIPQGLIMGGGALVAVAIVMVVVGLVRSRVNSEV